MMAVSMKTESEIWRPWGVSDNQKAKEHSYNYPMDIKSLNYMTSKPYYPVTPTISPTASPKQSPRLYHQHYETSAHYHNIENIEAQQRKHYEPHTQQYQEQTTTTSNQQQQYEQLKLLQRYSPYCYSKRDTYHCNDNHSTDIEHSKARGISKSFSSPCISNYKYENNIINNNTNNSNNSNNNNNSNSNIKKSQSYYHSMDSAKENDIQHCHRLTKSNSLRNINTTSSTSLSSPNSSKNYRFISITSPITTKQSVKQELVECTNCGVHKTTLWRRNASKKIVCNACGLYEHKYKRPRPLKLKNKECHF
eukprot:Pgem_evm1s16388